jgi:GNAT superfamily N-acetyltransferase
VNIAGQETSEHMSHSTTYRLEPADDLDAGRTNQVRRIYEGGFAPHLRAGFSSLVAEREPSELAFALTADDQPCGFAMLRQLGTTGWVYLRYFVVDEAQRGRGLGGILWDQLTARMAELGYSVLVFDVEDPDEPGTDPDEVQIRNRRITFYQRHGAWLLPVRGYRTPHDEDEDPDGWTPLRLMAADLTGGDLSADGQALVGPIVAAVYEYRWLLPSDHPQVRRTDLIDRAGDRPAGS